MNLPAPAESLCLVYMAAEQAAAGGSNEQLFLYIGLANGVCQRVRKRREHLAFIDGNTFCRLLTCRPCLAIGLKICISRNDAVFKQRICLLSLFLHVWSGCRRCDCGDPFRSPSAVPWVAASQVVPDQRPGQAGGK